MAHMFIPTLCSSRRIVSSILALLLVLGIAIGLSVVVTSIVLGRITAYSVKPSHVYEIAASYEVLAPSKYKVSVSLINPTRHAFAVYVEKAVIYTDGFTNSYPASSLYWNNTVIGPGETAKLELIAEIPDASVGVMAVWLNMTDMDSHRWYEDVVLIPIGGG